MPGHDACILESPVPKQDGSRANSFIIFIDRIFTTSVERAFTNVFDAFAASQAIACLCRVRHAD